MKSVFEPHLTLAKVVLQPGSEWAIAAPGWTFLLISSGVGYWLHPKSSQELGPGSVLLVSQPGHGVIRASQLSEVLVHSFRLDPARLNGLLTWGEQQTLERAACQDSFSTRAFSASTSVAESFKAICQQANPGSVPVRVKLLELALQAIGNKLWETQPDETGATNAKTRLESWLNSNSSTELSELSFTDLVRQIGCTPRHLSRIFHEVVGMPFREKQSQLRLVRAQELLATTQTKVLEVALESGFQSLSLFNLMFKRRFGLTPAKWRNQSREGKIRSSPGRRLRQPSLQHGSHFAGSVGRGNSV